MSTLAEDLEKLHALKATSVDTLGEKKEADAEFKKWMAHCLQRMETEQADSFRHKDLGYLFSVVTKVKGQIEDRRPYIRWALENDPAICDLLADIRTGYGSNDDLFDEDAFFEAIMGTSLVEYKEKTDVMNQQANTHVNNRQPLPPGLTFRPDPNISMRKS